MKVSKKILLNCSFCESLFKRFKCHNKNSKNIFCSKECRDSFYSISYSCEFCGIEFKRTKGEKRKGEKLGSKKTFCSMNCYRLNSQKSNTVSNCPVCKKQFTQTPWEKKSYRFCSPKCKSFEDQRREKGRNFRNGTALFRSISREAYGEICYSCRSTKHIEVHHLDKNRKNNTKENLRPLCRECHHHVHKGRLCLVL